ncbi:hypothetical protein CQA49_04685 [Helicobacter sp. MIT 00-7814]|uniref:hypothetical protein n=1 Tax=unclassified Helicobacter TaxID=2593540 RepID=UPI000E1E2F75|nr:MULTISPECIES: hypothetical protein [unclassified Helicobacter]RDU54604.1 hypothetical protein CQA49_04685 [Helicobacter sp. MIT 00-7814]RDU54663.1 hypothetical protein CQA37_05170 [Helicobacter sp. MIT 99-10781]
MKKHKFKILGALAFLAVIILGASLLYKRALTLKEQYKIDDSYLLEATLLSLKNEKCPFNPLVNKTIANDPTYTYIAHAGGGIIDSVESVEGGGIPKSYSYTNSKEALLGTLARGFKFIELDLMLDDEGKIFGAHDYKHFYSITGKSKEFLESKDALKAPNKDYIKNAKIFNQFTPLELDSINEIFNANPQAYLVTDKLNNFDAIITQLKLPKDHLLVEAFGLNNYYKARKAGILYPMLSSADFDLARKLGIPMLALHTSVLKNEKTLKQAQEFIANGGCIMAFSSNEGAFMDSHIGKGATMFYTDFWDIKSKECRLEDKAKCRTY